MASRGRVMVVTPALTQLSPSSFSFPLTVHKKEDQYNIVAM